MPPTVTDTSLLDDETLRRLRELPAGGLVPDMPGPISPVMNAAAPRGGAPTVIPPRPGPKNYKTGHSDLDLAERIDKSTPEASAAAKTEALQPIGAAPEIPGQPAVNTGLQPIGGGGIKPLDFRERQALPMTSPGTQPGTSAYDANKIARIEDQRANPWGSPENHPGTLGKIGHVAAKIGNIAGDILDPNAMARIPGTELHRDLTEQAAQERLGPEQTREEAQRAETAKEADEAEKNRLKGRELDIAENKLPKEATIDQKAVDAKVKEINPATGKNFTDYEARVQLAQDIADTKPAKAEAIKTITMLDKEGGKPYAYQYDPAKTYTGDEGHDHWKKIGPAKPDALSLGLIGTLTPLLGPDGSLQGTMNTKTGEIKPVKGNPLGAGAGGATAPTTSAGARLGNTERNQFNTQYVKPSTDIEQNYQKFQTALRDYEANPATGAASMVALAQHLGSTFGSIKGTSQGEHMIQEHKDAIGLFDKIGRYADQLATGQQLSANQWKEFNGLITQTRQIQWETAAKEAARRKQPIDFLPAEVHIDLEDSKGTRRSVPGNRVQEYLDKGAIVAR